MIRIHIFFSFLLNIYFQTHLLIFAFIDSNYFLDWTKRGWNIRQNLFISTFFFLCVFRFGNDLSLYSFRLSDDELTYCLNMMRYSFFRLKWWEFNISLISRSKSFLIETITKEKTIYKWKKEQEKKQTKLSHIGVGPTNSILNGMESASSTSQFRINYIGWAQHLDWHSFCIPVKKKQIEWIKTHFKVNKIEQNKNSRAFSPQNTNRVSF